MNVKFTLHFEGEDREDGEITQKIAFLKDTPFQDLRKELKLQESEKNKTFYMLGHMARHLNLSKTHRAEGLSEINLNSWLIVILHNH